eukprot:3320923-Prymnesium_polylepis.1
MVAPYNAGEHVPLEEQTCISVKMEVKDSHGLRQTRLQGAFEDRKFRISCTQQSFPFCLPVKDPFVRIFSLEPVVALPF